MSDEPEIKTITKVPEDVMLPPLTPETSSSSENQNHLTISTKLSTDQLISNPPAESPSISIEENVPKSVKKCKNKNAKDRSVFYLGLCQALLGCSMLVFGILAIIHEATLGQVGAGIWGGALALATGIVGLVAECNTFCPLRSTAQKLAHTVFLALCLLSLAISQLVVVLTATGIARDLNKVELGSQEIRDDDTSFITIAIPSNYLGLASNIALLIVSTLECIAACIACYKSARTICPCFKQDNESLNVYQDLGSNYYNNSHTLVSSWLGKHSPKLNSAPFYVVTHSPSTMGKSSKLTGGMPITPVFAFPQQMMRPHPMVPPRVPLIPAPLGPVPSPIIPLSNKRLIMYKDKRAYKKRQRMPEGMEGRPGSRPSSRRSGTSSPKSITEAEVAKTYTGLDRTIAEDFINICESKHNSLSSCSTDDAKKNCDESIMK